MAKRVDKRIIGATYTLGQCTVRTIAYAKLDKDAHARINGEDMADWAEAVSKKLHQKGIMKKWEVPEHPKLICERGAVKTLPVSKSGTRAGGSLGAGFSDTWGRKTKVEGVIIYVTEKHYAPAKKVLGELKVWLAKSKSKKATPKKASVKKVAAKPAKKVVKKTAVKRKSVAKKVVKKTAVKRKSVAKKVAKRKAKPKKVTRTRGVKSIRTKTRR